MKTRAQMILAARAAIADGRLPNEVAMDVAVERLMDSGDLDFTGAADQRQAGASSPEGFPSFTSGRKDQMPVSGVCYPNARPAAPISLYARRCARERRKIKFADYREN